MRSSSYDSSGNEAGTIADVLSKNLVGELGISPAGEKLVAVAPGYKLERLEPVERVLPTRAAAAESLVDPESFAEYVDRFKSPGSVAFASLSKRSIVAVLDYHLGTDGSAVAAPGPREHKVTLETDYSADFKRWAGAFAAGPMSQDKAATFVDDMAHTINAPLLADLLDVIRHVEIDRAIKLKSRKNPNSNAVVLSYEEIDSAGGTTGTGEVSIPTKIRLVLPVFEGAEPVTFDIRFKYSLERGALLFGFEAVGLDKTIRDEFRKIGATFTAACPTVPLYYAA